MTGRFSFSFDTTKLCYKVSSISKLDSVMLNKLQSSAFGTSNLVGTRMKHSTQRKYLTTKHQLFHA